MRLRTRAFLVVPAVVISVITAICLVAIGMVTLLDLPPTLHLPPPVRVLGLLIIVGGYFLFGWLLSYRSLADVIVSTYLSILSWSVARRRPATEGPPEPLILSGPHRHVRHPMYATVLVLFVGWWLALDATFLALAAVLLYVWYRFVVTRFEEAELLELYGDAWRAYAECTPRFFPSIRSGRRPHRDV